MEVGRKLGMLIAGIDSSIPVLIVGFVLGVLVILAEPAVYVLTHQIEDVTTGYVKRGIVLGFLSIGVEYTSSCRSCVYSSLSLGCNCGTISSPVI